MYNCNLISAVVFSSESSAGDSHDEKCVAVVDRVSLDFAADRANTHRSGYTEKEAVRKH